MEEKDLMKDLRELPRSVSRPTNNKCFHITGPSHDNLGWKV